MDLPNYLKCVEIRSHCCFDIIERLYYSAYPEDILCIHCGDTENLVRDSEEGAFPYCKECESRPRIHRRRSGKKGLDVHVAVSAYILLYNVCMLYGHLHSHSVCTVSA